ncbi:MAG TPA: 2-C-methyl-D-erythritol 2,4-cyclodiphosphate synthase [Firmicutes bacterium]|nr:2-C-methyl-D-erythritol 2,4-cyclodiphosphate synthase [Bacillota bacterium]
MTRIGLGYDSHRFKEGDGIFLGGVFIPFNRALAGHSDADAVIHALIDALLGAVGKGDIGEHFPDTDPVYAGSDSTKLLEKTMEMIAPPWAVENIDLVILAEEPKISPFVSKIRERLASLCRINPSSVSVKGKTNEGMGFIGRGEGIAVLASVLITRGDI